jgi:hypothetical protein
MRAPTAAWPRRSLWSTAGSTVFPALAGLVVVCGAAAPAAACRDDPFVHELRDDGDDFRAVSVLRQHELEARGTPRGLDCARLILGAYLRHGELDLVDDWVTRMSRSYASLLAPGLAPRLRVEVAYLIGGSPEVERRAGESGLRGLEPLILLARAADLPLSFDARETADCAAAACVELRRILDDRPRLPHRSPGLALALGVVPGLGQVYAGRVLAGLGSFLLNGFLIGTTAFALYRHEYALSVFSGGIGLAFYGGGVYAGYEAAARVNEHEAEQLRARIRAIPVDLELTRLAL